MKEITINKDMAHLILAALDTCEYESYLRVEHKMKTHEVEAELVKVIREAYPEVAEKYEKSVLFSRLKGKDGNN